MSGAGPAACRGIRGATTVEGDRPEAVREATLELLDTLVSANGCEPADIAAVIFTLSDDLEEREVQAKRTDRRFRRIDFEAALERLDARA
jgi:chorismate mutase